MKFIPKITSSLSNASIVYESSKQVPFSIKALISWTLKLSLSGLCLAYVINELINEQVVFEILWQHIISLDLGYLLGVLAFSTLLFCANWGLEIFKWHLLIGRKLGTHWRSAIKGVLSGSTIGIVTPNRLGEFLGRVLALGPKQRVKATLLSIVNGVAQTVATLSFGLISLTFLIDDLVGVQLGSVGVMVLKIVFVLTWALSIGFYFNLPSISKAMQSWRLLEKWKSSIEVVSGMNNAQLNELYALSLLRFLTFIGQYIIVFGFLMNEPNWQLVIGLSVISLFSNTILSFLPIPDVLVRQAVAISYFGLFDFDLGVVSVAVFFVWLINVALPAMIGALVLLTYRIFKQV